MGNELVVAALVKKRAHLAGEIEATHERLSGMLRDLENLDAMPAIFDPTYEVEAIKPKAFRPPKEWSNRGEMSRVILSTLRQASEPLTSRDIALQLLVDRALDRNDQTALAADDKARGDGPTGPEGRWARGFRARAGAVQCVAVSAVGVYGCATRL